VKNRQSPCRRRPFVPASTLALQIPSEMPAFAGLDCGTGDLLHAGGDLPFEWLHGRRRCDLIRTVLLSYQL